MIYLEIQGHTAPHLKAFIFGKHEPRWHSCGNTSSFLKSDNLPNKWGFVDSQTAVIISSSNTDETNQEDDQISGKEYCREIIVTIIGIGSGIWNKYSSLFLVYQMFSGAYEHIKINYKTEPQLLFGTFTLLPLIFNLFFQIYQWAKYERYKMKTGISLVLLIYPQLCEARLLYLLIRRKKSWRAKKNDFELRLNCLGKIIL